MNEQSLVAILNVCRGQHCQYHELAVTLQLSFFFYSSFGILVRNIPVSSVGRNDVGTVFDHLSSECVWIPCPSPTINIHARPTLVLYFNAAPDYIFITTKACDQPRDPLPIVPSLDRNWDL